MKKLWVIALVFLLAPVVIKAQVQTFQRGGEVIKVEKLWSSSTGSSVVNAVLVDEQKRIFIGGDIFNSAPRLRMSTDSGKIWTPDGGYDPYATVYAFVSVDSGYVLAGTETGIFRSKDHGKSWQRVFFPTVVKWGEIFSLLVAKNKTIFASAYRAIYCSIDNGNSWSVSTDSTMVYPYAWSMAQLPDGTILAGNVSGSDHNSKGVIRSTNYGKTWVNSSPGLADSNIQGITAYPSGYSQRAYLVTKQGAYLSENGGQSWTFIPQISNKYGSSAFTHEPLGVFLGFAFPDKDGYTLYRSYGAVGWLGVPGIKDWVGCMAEWSASQILVGTSSGLYLVSFSNPLPVHESPTLVSDFQLFQNYPNPFNPSTTIEFSLPERSFVKLIITNILGQEVATLVASELQAGTHRIEWNAASMPSGVYLYRLVSGNFVSTRKMLLMK